MEDGRPNSEVLLKRLQYEEEMKRRKSRGKLKIFLGYAAGSGKTYTMLEAAHDAKTHGVDVVAGYIEPHDRPDTMKLAQGLETLPYLQIDYKGVKLREFDLDAALIRRPQLIIVDELAHTNAHGCRNEKRYQDVQELLRAGINVYTTINIQHLESLNDVVENITRIRVRERIPDSVFDHADQVEVIDIEPEDLIDRMKEGKIYKKTQAMRALDHFFRREKLAALREITLRRMAERVKHIAEEERSVQGELDYHTGEHILVCISAAQSNAKVIRAAARLAYAFRCQFTGLYVETSAMQEADVQTKEKLRQHIELAKTLGAKIVTVFGEDVGRQIAEYALVGNVSKVVIGRTNHRFFSGTSRFGNSGKIKCSCAEYGCVCDPGYESGAAYNEKSDVLQTKKRMENGAVGSGGDHRSDGSDDSGGTWDADVEFIGIQHHHDLHFRSPAVLLYRGQPVICPVFFPARRAVI